MMNTPPLALCVGHSRLVNGHPEGGARAVDGTAEWNYNLGLAARIRDALAAHRTPAIIVSEYQGNGYTHAQQWLATQLRLRGCPLAIELHFNDSDDPAATGHEWLYWHSSTSGKALADHLSAEMALAVPQLRARGTKPKTPSDRGAEFLKLPPCPCVIAETGFGTNPADWQLMTTRKTDIARAIADGILEFLS